MSENYNFNLWYETYDPVFSEISRNSRIPIKWYSFEENKSLVYKTTIIKPINRYVEVLYPKPKLIDISDNIIRLRQYNHAEFFLLEKRHNQFFNLDRPWMRQYYQTKEHPEKVDGCFDPTYKFYTPWVIDENVKISIEQPQEDSPFFIYETSVQREKMMIDQSILEPDFVSFKFKRVGPHMVSDKFGKIKLNTPLFDIVFEGSGTIVERVKDFYEQH
jgi:hypothetical protein